MKYPNELDKPNQRQQQNGEYVNQNWAQQKMGGQRGETEWTGKQRSRCPSWTAVDEFRAVEKGGLSGE